MQIYHLPIPVPDFLVSIHIWLSLRCKEIKYNCKLRGIKLTLGKYAIVSLEDYERLNRHKWHTLTSHRTFYAMRTENYKTIYMHNEVIPPQADKVIDHIDRNGLNNSRSNLRLASRSQNCYNRKKKAGVRSKYKGVSYVKDRKKKWRVCVTHNGKRIYLGYFDNQFDAAKAYDNAAKKYHKNFAVLNFP
ncbi:MAG: HNH endonuclease [Planctomycetes bacterium]|nr:HNH endonuclease [Planctomycetota bacterium]MBU1517342.1 HNH endonuclease [Planctomycetota bacterium]MBU2458446.1 HNH endonuclease [Planctomycetota bacterium]MBU2597329.1 HNH endonuclease [Planctomycetota bacterium]